MIISVRALPSFVAAPPFCSSLAIRWETNPNPGRHPRRSSSSSATSSATMVLATDSDVDKEMVDTPALSWKPPWERRRETSGMLTGVEYDTGAIDAFFEHRPERASARFAQIVLEAGGAVLALASDQLTNGIFAGGSNGSNGSGNANGDGERPTGSAPLHIRRAVTRLGPNFVKIGQALASRPDLVGEAIAGELLLLQDAMPFFSHEIAREFIHEELGAYPEDVFEDIGDTPVAAASLGQVYKASIGGRAVAVKVQRPDLLEAVALDFYLARGIAAAIMRLSQSPMFFGGRVEVRSDLVAAVDEYGSRLFEELDYRKEAQNMVRFRELYGAMPSVVVPEVLLDLSGKRVITSEWIDGEKLVDDQAQVSPVDLPILRVGIDCTLTQLLDKGFLHADPHGGNLLKTVDKRLVYLDFGLVSVIPPGVMDALICATVYVMNRDYVALAKGFPALALMSEGDLSEDFGPFASALQGALDPIVTDFRQQMGLDGGFGDEAPSGSERVAFAQLIDRVFLLARSFNFSVPPYFISNVRALGELEGLAMTADPGFNLISVVYPYVCHRLLSDPNPSLRAALEDLIVAGDGSLRWEVVEALMRDSNALDERVGAGGKTRRAPLDLSLEFILSEEGAFVRRAVVSDLKSVAVSSLRNFPRIFRGRRPSSNTPSPSSPAAAISNRRKSRESSEDAVPSFEGNERVVGGKALGGATTAREASRRLLRKRAFSGARRRPDLVARVGVSIVAAAGRAVGTAFLGVFRGVRFARRRTAAGT